MKEKKTAYIIFDSLEFHLTKKKKDEKEEGKNFWLWFNLIKFNEMTQKFIVAGEREDEAIG